VLLANTAALVNNYANGIRQGAIVRLGACLQPGTIGTNGNNKLVKLFDQVLNPREIRRRLGLNQEQFWTQIGVTQSGGSRYESGREMPKPVRELLRLVHVEQVDLSQVKRVDFDIISYLKESHPDLYRNLRRAARGKNKQAESERVATSDNPFRQHEPETVDDRD
jgi:transcriptional regulator with XRE-family HTH domain